jgi:hypothetical protein
VLVGVLEEIDDLLQLDLGLVGACDVEEGDAGLGHLLNLLLERLKSMGPPRPPGPAPGLPCARRKRKRRLPRKARKLARKVRPLGGWQRQQWTDLLFTKIKKLVVSGPRYFHNGSSLKYLGNLLFLS